MVSLLARIVMFRTIHHPNDSILIHIAKIVNNRPFIIDHCGRHDVIIFDLANLDRQSAIDDTTKTRDNIPSHHPNRGWETDNLYRQNTPWAQLGRLRGNSFQPI